MMPNWIDSLREWRDDEGYTLAEAAHAIGVCERTIEQITAGHNSACSPTVARKIHRATGYPVENIPICHRGEIACGVNLKRKKLGYPAKLDPDAEDCNHSRVVLLVGEWRYSGGGDTD